MKIGLPFDKRWRLAAAIAAIVWVSACDKSPGEQAGSVITDGEGIGIVTQEIQATNGSGAPGDSLPDMAGLRHETMAIRIGTPAGLRLGDPYPQVAVKPEWDGSAALQLTHVDSGEAQALVSAFAMTAQQPFAVTIPGQADQPGLYRIDLDLQSAASSARYVDAFYFTVHADWEANGDKALYLNNEGQLVYVPDYRGNRVPDYSVAGYGGGGAPLPEAPVVLTLSPEEGDATARIQEAIDQVAGMPMNEAGVRGAILLKRGVYEIAGTLNLWASGVVLRGEGRGDPAALWLDPDERRTLEALKESLSGKDATVLIATRQGSGRLIQVQGPLDMVLRPVQNSAILDNYVPVGANTFRVERPDIFEVGDPIVVRRAGNEAWISEIGMDRIMPSESAWDQEYGTPTTPWEPFELRFEHTIVAIDGDRITIDGTIVNAIEKRWGGGGIIKYEERRSHNIGVENLRAISYWMPNEHGEDDTRHAHQFVLFNQVINSWVRDVTVEHFFGINSGAMETGRRSRSITIQDAASLIADRSVYAGPGYDSSGRIFHETGVYAGRYGFSITGQGGLVQRSYVLNSRRSYYVSSQVPGPNVFLYSQAVQSMSQSEPHHRWSVGGLYDNVRDDINLMNRYHYGGSHGWAGANYVAWNTEGTLILQQPPTAQNWSFGHTGPFGKPPFEGEDGYRSSPGERVAPESLYLQQLKERLGEEALRHIGY